MLNKLEFGLVIDYFSLSFINLLDLPTSSPEILEFTASSKPLVCELPAPCARVNI